MLSNARRRSAGGAQAGASDSLRNNTWRRIDELAREAADMPQSMIEHYKEEIIFYVYRKQEDSSDKLIGRIVYDTQQLAPLRREYWTVTKLTAKPRREIHGGG